MGESLRGRRDSAEPLLLPPRMPQLPEEQDVSLAIRSAFIIAATNDLPLYVLHRCVQDDCVGFCRTGDLPANTVVRGLPSGVGQVPAGEEINVGCHDGHHFVFEKTRDGDRRKIVF